MQRLSVTHSSPPSTASSRLPAEVVTAALRRLFSAYRKDDFADPDGFSVQAAVVLSEYSEEVVAYVTDPRTGIQRRNKFPPNLAEIGEACDAAKKQLAAEERLKKSGWHWNGEKWTNGKDQTGS